LCSITALLEKMGASPDEVADTMRACDVHGLRDSTSFFNPVVRYLNRNLGIGGRLEVGAGGAVLRLLIGNEARGSALPAPVREFLERFHQGLYPDLEG
jgi:hypothetical protein